MSLSRLLRPRSSIGRNGSRLLATSNTRRSTLSMFVQVIMDALQVEASRGCESSSKPTPQSSPQSWCESSSSAFCSRHQQQGHPGRLQDWPLQLWGRCHKPVRLVEQWL